MLLLLNIQHLFKYKCNTIFVVSFIISYLCFELLWQTIFTLEALHL